MNKVTLACVVAALIGCGCAVRLESDRAGVAPCNVFTGSACFTISHGDVATTQVVVDYMLYRLKIANSFDVTIYSGYNPSPRDVPTVAWNACKNVLGFSECRERQLGDGMVEVVARPSKEAEYIHVIADGGDQTQNFLATIHPCASDAFSTHCDAKRGR